MGKEKIISAELSYPNCDIYAGSDETCSVYIWKASLFDPIIIFRGLNSPAITLLLDSDMGELYCGLRGGMISVYDIFNQKVKVNLQGHSSIITSMTIYRRNDTPCALASASADGKIKLWDLKTRSPTTNFKGHFSEINTLTFSPDFTYLASGANDGIVKIWDIRMTNKSLKEISSPEQKAINCIEFNPYAVAFAYGAKDKKIRYWNLEKFNKIGESTADRLPIERLAFDNEGKNMFCATNESLKYWEITEHGINLIDMFETGWNKLQSFHYVEGRAVCALSTFSNKISYYLIKYKELMKAPNMRLRADPNMGNISEVQESEDSTFFENDLNLHLDVPKTPIGRKNNIEKNTNNKFDEYMNTNHVLKDFEKNSKKPKSSKPNSSTNLGISKFINNTTMSNVSVTLSDISSSKIENESVFVKNAINMIGANNYKGPIVPSGEKKIYNPDDRPLPIPRDLELKNKKNIANDTLNNNNNNNNNNKDESNFGKIMIGNISNLDISDSEISKNDISLGSIFGKTNNFNSNNTILNNNINNNINIKNNPLIESLEKNKNINDEDFRELGEKDLDAFLGKSGHNKDIDEISVIQSSGIEDDNFIENNIFNMTNRSLASALKNNANNPNEQNKENELVDINNTINNNINLAENKKNEDTKSNNNNNTSIDNNSFASLNSNQTLGLDFTELLKENGGMNDNKNVSQAEDLPILQEINSQHDNMRRAITRRYNAIKTLSRRWGDSNIHSTLNELNIMKDTAITNDFFVYAIINRDDISKIPFPLETGVNIISHIQNLLRSKFDVYWKTACSAGIIFLKIFMEKIEITKQQYKMAGPMGQTDPILEEKMKSSDDIIKLFKQIFNSKHLKAHFKPGDKYENNIAYAFYTDLEFFLRPYDDNRIVIKSVY